MIKLHMLRIQNPPGDAGGSVGIVRTKSKKVFSGDGDFRLFHDCDSQGNGV